MTGVDTRLEGMDPVAADRPKGILVRILPNVALIAFGVGMALALGELLVRIAAPQLIYRFPRDLFVPDPVVSYRLRPGFDGRLDTPEYRTDMRINAQGLRDDRDYGPKEAGVTRILMIGDSFTMGVGVDLDQTFIKQLESALNAGTVRKRVEILNAGVSGYSTAQEARFLQAYGFAFEPDVVVLGFFVGNDVAENGGTPSIVEDGYLAEPGREPGFLPWVGRLLAAHSQLYHLAWPYERRLRAEGRAQDRWEAAKRSVAYLVDDTHDPAWSATYAALQQIVDAGRNAHIPVAIVLIPESTQVDDAQWAALASSIGPGASAYDQHAPIDRLSRFGSERHVPTFDLLPAFRDAGEPAKLYFRQDHHWTVAGNTVAARSMEHFLRDLIPATN
jgi:lysophospholipase L1-like esterase